MQAISFLWFVLFLIFFFPSTATVATGTNSCRTCHTNEAILKALYKPPTIEAGEGEG